MRKKEYLKSRSVIVQGIHSPKRFWFACGLSLGLVSLPLSTFANNWSNQLGSSIQKSIQQNRIITGSVIDESGEAFNRRFRIGKRNYFRNGNRFRW